ncbi:hypothetical protein A2818_00330 [Candidatus Nomurabacteria bacterium RIFCSPHIGHO2_01_FULL_40_12]|uniref:Uncharacterized protein n=1 Tax=Candidatus Nomurabacteria bacterium RIFCSPHIGHO2_01_FULL_40_12 TaxID=1801737 RepID=A0A1F6V0L3_9BACT|nr:MAG: hypothetical protein A2818_00330 [Candidatus Nomurabacteria bacterium RIFCSPHIGHO2_01_FULL_40_12]
MIAEEFIKRKLNELKSVEKTAVNFASTKELADFTFKTVMSKKFRKFSVSPEYILHIREAIDSNLNNNQPIKFIFPFGGYKLWRLEEAPEADWAELFSIMYYAKWLKPITEVYKPGIYFDFSSDDIIVERMNNIPKSDTESYAKSFQTTLDFLKDYLPENMKLTLTQVSSLYTQEEFEEDLKDKINAMQEELGGLPVLNERDKRMVELNVRLKPGQDSDSLWREKIELIHQAYYGVSRRRPYTRAPDKILAFCTQINNCVPVGTTKTSIAKFWVGVGALKKISDSFMEYVLSPSQLETAKFNWEPIAINGLSGKNFNKIRIIDDE